jgi:hypothetical protein
MPTERQLLTLRLTAAAIAVVTVGFAIGATIAAEAVRRDNRPEFQHLTGEMNLRAEPDVDSDTVRLLPTGTILRLGLPDHNGWAPAGDVRNRRIGYIYTRTDRVAEGLPDGLAVTSPSRPSTRPSSASPTRAPSTPPRPPFSSAAPSPASTAPATTTHPPPTSCAPSSPTAPRPPFRSTARRPAAWPPRSPSANPLDPTRRPPHSARNHAF